MALTPSKMTPLESSASSFKLPNYHSIEKFNGRGELVSLDSFSGAHGLLVMFICNHCPYVIHLNQGLVKLAKRYLAQGIAFVAINPNDINNYPEDSPERMSEVAAKEGYPFPYLFDETQEVAQIYGATCTPDFFLYDQKRTLFYRGRIDGSTPGNSVPVTASEISVALDALVAGDKPPQPQYPSMGCSIKWKA
jgi:thiol-disulfide isomerase/thioredoxin